MTLMTGFVVQGHISKRISIYQNANPVLNKFQWISNFKYWIEIETFVVWMLIIVYKSLKKLPFHSSSPPPVMMNFIRAQWWSLSSGAEDICFACGRDTSSEVRQGRPRMISRERLWSDRPNSAASEGNIGTIKLSL